MTYQRERVDRMQRRAMELIHYADAECGSELPIRIRTLMYTRAAAYCALAGNERFGGQVDHPNEEINRYFNSLSVPEMPAWKLESCDPWTI